MLTINNPLSPIIPFLAFTPVFVILTGFLILGKPKGPDFRSETIEAWENRLRSLEIHPLYWDNRPEIQWNSVVTIGSSAPPDC